MNTKKRVTMVVATVLVFSLSSVSWAQDYSVDSSESSTSTDNDQKDNNNAREGGGLKIDRPLLLTRHTMELGGQIAINPEVVILKGDVPDKSAGGGSFTFSPYLGYFVIDKLELLFNFHLNVPFGTLRGGNDVSLGFDVGARYFFDFNVVALYLGGMVGPSWQIPDNPNAVIRDYFTINFMVGILVPLNKHIGVDFGMRMITNIRLDNDFPDGGARTTISFPIGYFGVNGFFNIISGG